MGSYQYTDLLLTSWEASCQKNVRLVSYIKFPQTQLICNQKMTAVCNCELIITCVKDNYIWSLFSETETCKRLLAVQWITEKLFSFPFLYWFCEQIWRRIVNMMICVRFLFSLYFHLLWLNIKVLCVNVNCSIALSFWVLMFLLSHDVTAFLWVALVLILFLLLYLWVWQSFIS